MVCLECFVVKMSVLVLGLLWIALMERSKGFGDGDEGILRWTLGVVRFLFRLGWIICPSIVDVWFWFWLGCLVLLRSRGAWRNIGFKGSDSNACLSANV